MLQGFYDAKNGLEPFMYGIQTVMEYIAINDSEDTYEKFSEMFTKNIVKSKEKYDSDKQVDMYSSDQQDACYEHTFRDCGKCGHTECKHKGNIVEGTDRKE